MSDNRELSKFPLITHMQVHASCGTRVALISCYLHYDQSVLLTQDVMDELALQVKMFVEERVRR